MPMHQIHESAATGRGGFGCNVAVRVLQDNGDGTTLVQIEDSGIYLRQGQTRTVNTDEIRRTR